MRKVLILALTTACTSPDTKATTDSATKAYDAETGAPATQMPSESTVSLTAADLDGFEKGLAREIYLVKDGQLRAQRATTPVERGNAIQSTFEENTMSKAVPESGLPLERYRLVRQTISRLLTTLDFQGKIDGPQSVDTAHADPEMKARLAGDPYTALDPASAELLKARMNRIAPLWIEYINLTVVGG
jgi:hypothetical protein